MEKICDSIYIDNSKMLLVKFDENGEHLFRKGDINFIDVVNAELKIYQDYNYVEKILSIMPSTATKAEFILSNRCNMGCIYCYSSTSRNNTTLNFKQATIIIDRLITNSIIKNIKLGREKKIYLSFHGGGEPSCEFDLLKRIVEYAKVNTKKNQTELYLEITTNLSHNTNEILDFYLQNNFFVHISMDGIEEIQNYQRPYIDGSNSFGTVVRNISYLSRHNGLFSIRLTVTEYSLKYVVESMKYLKGTFPNVCFIKLAPLQVSEASHEHDIEPPRVAEYLKVIEEVDKLDWKKDSQYISVFGEMNTLVNSGMCASVRFEQIIVSPEGRISSCHEDPLSKNFDYGNITEEGFLQIDIQKVKELKRERYDNICIGRCSKCAFRMLCMGGCKQRMLGLSKDMFCIIEKYMLCKHIKHVFIKAKEIGIEHKYVEYSYGDNKGYMEFILLGGER